MKASIFALMAFAAVSASASALGHGKDALAARHHNVAKAHHPSVYNKKRAAGAKAARCAAKTSSLVSVSTVSTASVASESAVSVTSVAHVSAISTASVASVASVSSHSAKSVESTHSRYEATHTSEKPKPTKDTSDDDDDSGSSGGGGSHTGDATFYEIGMNSCGWTDHEPDMIVAVSIPLSQDFPGYTGNSNTNPICNKKIRACWEGKCVTVRVTDCCAGCAYYSLDFSKAAFNILSGGNMGLGRLHGMTWDYV